MRNVLIVNGQPTTLGVILMLLPLTLVVCESWCLPSLKGKMGCSMRHIILRTNVADKASSLRFNAELFFAIPTYTFLLYLMGFGGTSQTGARYLPLPLLAATAVYKHFLNGISETALLASNHWFYGASPNFCLVFRWFMISCWITRYFANVFTVLQTLGTVLTLGEKWLLKSVV